MYYLSFAKKLRSNMTEAEICLWQHLRKRQICGYKFRRQYPLGKYIVDFICIEAKLIIEIDGCQHMEQTVSDNTRTEWLNSQGFKVLRFWNNEIFENIEGVIDVIFKALGID